MACPGRLAKEENALRVGTVALLYEGGGDLGLGWRLFKEKSTGDGWLGSTERVRCACTDSKLTEDADGA